MIWCHIPINMMSYSNKYDVIFQYIWCHTYLSHARSLHVHPNFQATTRATSDNFVACCSRCRLKIWVYAQAPCVRATNRYGIIFIGIWHHIHWNMASYLLEYDIIFIRIWHHIYLLLYSNSDKNYIQTITSVKFLGGIPPNNSKNIDI